MKIIAHEHSIGGRVEDNIAGRNVLLEVNRTLRQYQSDERRKKPGESLRPRDTQKPNTGISQRAVGGFLGAGEKDVAVPFDAIRITTKDNNKWYLVMNATKDELKSAPGFKYDKDSTTWVPDKK
jgi:hypothetical protein